MTRKIAIAVHEGVQALDVAGPVDVFAEANGFLPRDAGYEILLVAAGREPIRASNGMRLIADLTFAEALGPFDIALVAGGPALPEAAADPHLAAWLRRHRNWPSFTDPSAPAPSRLAHAGLLDGRMVTTHWQNAQQLAARFPAANVVPDRIYIRDGRMVTSAGVSAGIDLALSLVGEHHGPKTAVAVAKRLVVVAQRQGGQSQFSPYLAPVHGDSPIARIQVHVMARLADRHSLRSLAAVAGMSPRNLSRHFVQETGVTPHEFVERARIDAARMQLEAGAAALKAVAFECGFVTADRMRVVFTERLGVSPAQYRASFGRTEELPVRN